MMNMTKKCVKGKLCVLKTCQRRQQERRGQKEMFVLIFLARKKAIHDNESIISYNPKQYVYKAKCFVI